MYIIYIFRIIVLIFVAMFITMFWLLYASSGGWNVKLDIPTTWRRPERTTAETSQ